MLGVPYVESTSSSYQITSHKCVLSCCTSLSSMLPVVTGGVYLTMYNRVEAVSTIEKWMHEIHMRLQWVITGLTTGRNRHAALCRGGSGDQCWAV